MNIIQSHSNSLTTRIGKDRIDLIPLEDKHFPFLYKWYADPEVVYWTDGGVDEDFAYDPPLVKKKYNMVSKKALCFLIKFNNVPIGDCWLQKVTDSEVLCLFSGKDVRRIDMAIGEKSYWGKGIGGCFAKAIIDFAFGKENIDLLYCFAENYNHRSIKIWERNHFELFKKERLKPLQKGEYQLHFVLSKKRYRSFQRLVQ